MSRGEEAKPPFGVGDHVMYFEVIGDSAGEEYVVDGNYPDGIPSCRQPMVKLRGKAGLVLRSHCVPLVMETQS